MSSTHSSSNHTSIINAEIATISPSQAQSCKKKSYPPPEAEYDEIVQNPDFFLGKLKGFHGSYGTRFKIPTIGGRALDLYRLFVEVTSRGGIEKVMRDRKWKEVIAAFNFPSTITSASFVVRKYYLSLLYHFEQAYYFRKEVPSISLDDPGNMTPVNGLTAPHVREDLASISQLPGHMSFGLEPGSSVNGIIDAKFDDGYLITVKLGSEKLKGVLYHTPPSLDTSQSPNTSAVPHHWYPSRSELSPRDPSRAKPNRSGYNFSFAEGYTTQKPLYHGKEKGQQQENWSSMEQAHRC